MATGAAVAAVVGTGFSIFGQLKQAKAQKEAALAQADAKRAQAFELLERVEFNIDQLEEETEKFKGRQRAAFAASGVDVGSGVSLVQMEQVNRDLIEEIQAQREEARFKAAALEAGADVDTRLGGDISQAGRLGAIGTGLKGLSSAFDKFGTGSTTPSKGSGGSDG